MQTQAQSSGSKGLQMHASVSQCFGPAATWMVTAGRLIVAWITWSAKTTGHVMSFSLRSTWVILTGTLWTVQEHIPGSTSNVLTVLGTPPGSKASRTAFLKILPTPRGFPVTGSLVGSVQRRVNCCCTALG